MPTYPIFHRWSGMPIALLSGESFAEALELAVQRAVTFVYADLRRTDLAFSRLNRADLRGADLSDCELSEVVCNAGDLRTANLARAILRQANLRQANLRQADLRDADLRLADLEEAHLVGADLRGALLQGAKLRGATLDWRFSTIPVELLQRDHDASTCASGVLVDLALADDSQPFAWLKLLVRHHPQAELVLRVLAKHIRPDDNAPELLRTLAADVAAGGSPGPAALTSGEQQETGPMLWTRRAPSAQAPIAPQSHLILPQSRALA